MIKAGGKSFFSKILPYSIHTLTMRHKDDGACPSNVGEQLCKCFQFIFLRRRNLTNFQATCQVIYSIQIVNCNKFSLSYKCWHRKNFLRLPLCISFRHTFSPHITLFFFKSSSRNHDDLRYEMHGLPDTIHFLAKSQLKTFIIFVEYEDSSSQHIEVIFTDVV